MNSDKLKVLFIEKSKIFAGAEYSLLSLLQALDKENVQPFILSDYPLLHHNIFLENNFKILYREKGVKWWMGSDYSSNSPRGTDFIKRIILGIKLGRLLRKKKIDILHINLLRKTDIIDLLIAKIIGCKTVGHIRSLPNQNKIPIFLFKICDKIICTSEFVLDHQVNNRFKQRSVRIYDPINIESQNFTKINKKNIKESFGIGEDKFVISSIAILDKRKGHDIAIETLKNLISQNPNLHLIIAGGNSSNSTIEENRLKELAKTYHLSENITFTGHVENIKEIFAISKVVLCLSRDGEAFGRVPLEAAIAGIPVIATARGATPEIIKNGITGFLVEPDNRNEICEIILKLLNQDDLRDFIVKNALEHVKSFSSVIHAKQVEEVYGNINKKC